MPVGAVGLGGPSEGAARFGSSRDAAAERPHQRRQRARPRLAVGGADVWVADDFGNTVSRIDAASGGGAVTRTTPVGPGPGASRSVRAASGSPSRRRTEVLRIDPATGAATETIAVGERPTGIAVGAGGVWVANSLSGTVSRIDPETNEVDLEVDLGQSPEGVAVSRRPRLGDVSAAPEPPAGVGDADGAPLRILMSQDPADLDPAQHFFDSQRAYATCAALFNYPDEPAPEGSMLEPEVAAGPPEVSDDGRTYTFEIRSGFEFSPPSDRAGDRGRVRAPIERVLEPEPEVLWRQHHPGHRRGAGVRLRGGGRRRRSPGDRRQLVVRLTAAAPDIVARLSTPWFCAVPPQTPIAPIGSSLIPSAGPYYVESYDPESRIVLRRNPNYDGDRPAGFEEIDYELGIPPDRAVDQVEAGEADYYTSGVVGRSISARSSRASTSATVREAKPRGQERQQFFVTPQLSVHYLVYNTHRPPFDDPRIRRAVNFAIDRSALAREPFPDSYGRPTDQLLPPGLPGFADQAIYPLGRPDLERARRLAGPLDARAVLYTCNLPACASLGQVVRDNLAAIGIAVEVEEFPIPELFDRIGTPGEPFDLAQTNFFADYPDPFDFINFLFQPGLGFNAHLFEDPAATAEMERAATLSGAERYDAYAKLDRELSAELAVGVPYANGTLMNLFSARIGCQVDQPIYGIDLGRLCVR